jgi:hypothetical protein
MVFTSVTSTGNDIGGVQLLSLLYVAKLHQSGLYAKMFVAKTPALGHGKELFEAVHVIKRLAEMERGD